MLSAALSVILPFAAAMASFICKSPFVDVALNETLLVAPAALTTSAVTEPAAMTSIDPLVVVTLVRVIPFPPRRRISPDDVEDAVTLLPLASSSRLSAAAPPIWPLAMSEIIPPAVMSVTVSSWASRIEPFAGVAASIAESVTLFPAVIAPILIPFNVVSNVTLLVTPVAFTRTALSGPAAVTLIDPFVEITDVSVIPSNSRTTIPPEKVLFAVRVCTVESRLIPVAAFAKRFSVVTSTNAVPFWEIDPRSPSAAPSPKWSRSASRRTV